MHILLIEPDQLLGRTYVRALELAGHTVHCVADGQSAVQQADAQRPDAVVLELLLPGVNGIAFLQEFRSYSDWSDVPVLMHTALPLTTAEPMRQAVADQYGVVDWLYKPQTTLEQLVIAVHGAQKARQT